MDTDFYNNLDEVASKLINHLFKRVPDSEIDEWEDYGSTYRGLAEKRNTNVFFSTSVEFSEDSKLDGLIMELGKIIPGIGVKCIT